MTTLAFIMFDGAGGALGGWAAGRLYQVLTSSVLVSQQFFFLSTKVFCLWHPYQNLLLGQRNMCVDFIHCRTWEGQEHTEYLAW